MRRRINSRRTKTKKEYKKFIIAITVVLTFAILFSVVFAIFNIGSNKILNRIKIEGVDVSKLTQSQAIERMNNWYSDTILKPITVKYEDLEETISIEELDISQNINEKVDEAYSIGRTGNILKDNYQILITAIFNKNIKIEINVNEEKLDKKIEEINSKIPNTVAQSNYYIEDEKLIIKNGTEGIKIKDEFKQNIKKAILSENKKIIIPIENVKPEKINIEKIHEEIYKEAKDAYIENNGTVHPQVIGIDFDMNLEKVNKLLNEEKEEYIIPLKIVMPNISIEQLGKEAFPNKLGGFSTIYDARDENRSNNLELASEKINGTIILPGETFSYNKVVGERTISKGYKEAPVYSGGKVINGVGGGICQLSSTLYNAVVYANLEITNRSNHRFLTSYVTEGRDATVSWGTIDFCFKNTRSYPIKIISTIKNGVAQVEIYGIKEEKEYEVVIETNITETIPYETKYINDNTLEVGKEEIKQYGANGAKSTTYKIVKYNGAIISKTILSTDTYSQLERIVKKGTKEPYLKIT